MSTPASLGNNTTPLAVIVMGVSGAGKSTLGVQLAAALGGIFVEGDRFHDAASIEAMSAGRPLTDADRWPWLDRVAKAMQEGITATGIAVAACSALKRAYRDRLATALCMTPRFVFLDGTADDLRRRLRDRSGHYMPASLLDSQLATLEPPTAFEPALILPAAEPTAQLCRAVVTWLKDVP